MILRIDQARIAEWIAANPDALHGAAPAEYPRPLAWWREFAPDWVAVAEEPGGIITMTPARTAGTAVARRARDDALRHWIRGVRPLAAAITEEQT